MQKHTLNPLSLIAIFAGIIEASALASLPFLNESSQSIYTWFLVGFPFFLTVLFFLTLNFNAHSLFTPGPTELAAKASPAQPATATSAQHNTGGGPIIIALSGPQRRKHLEQHLLGALDLPPGSAASWVLYNLDERTCIELSVGPMQADGAQPLTGAAP
jgi:hypothetical protein